MVQGTHRRKLFIRLTQVQNRQCNRTQLIRIRLYKRREQRHHPLWRWLIKHQPLLKMIQILSRKRFGRRKNGGIHHLKTHQISTQHIQAFEFILKAHFTHSSQLRISRLKCIILNPLIDPIPTKCSRMCAPPTVGTALNQWSNQQCRFTV